jgi:hypothetical protein
VAISNKQVPTAMKQPTTTEELLEVVFSVVHTMAITTQWHSKLILAATV